MLKCFCELFQDVSWAPGLRARTVLRSELQIAGKGIAELGFRRELLKHCCAVIQCKAARPHPMSQALRMCIRSVQTGGLAVQSPQGHPAPKP